MNKKNKIKTSQFIFETIIINIANLRAMRFTYEHKTFMYIHVLSSLKM